MRRTLGTLAIAAGATLLLGAGTQHARAALAREEARTQWEIVEARRRADALRASVDGLDAAALVPGAPLARLVVPAIGLDEVVVEGVGESSLRAGPGHLPGSALPGDSGNAVVSAHRDRHFDRLGRVKVGDEIVTTDGRATHHWVVAEMRVVRAGAPALHATATPTLTLTTCWPIRWFGPAPERLIVTAVPKQGA